jgi:hypothetical protein
VAPVWSAHPVGFCLLTRAPFQFVAFYDANRQMTVAQRRLDETRWTFTKLPSITGWDSHNSLVLALDRNDCLHLSGNMHCVPLVYFRSEKPLDASTLRRVAHMAGDREERVTYPVFLHDKAGRLVFRHRDGGSGNGDDLYNVYDEATRSWSRLYDRPLLSGRGLMNAYATVPERGPDGRFHMIWVWRDTPDCASNHDLGYACSDDLSRWTDSSGRQMTLPITRETGEVVDPVPAGGGLLNANRNLGFDSRGRPMVSYHKYDASGNLQVFVARREASGWNIRQVSDWAGYRWAFSGGGTILMEVRVGTVKTIGENRLSLDYRYPQGAGAWVLDEDTLRPIPGAKPPPSGNTHLPASLARVESGFPGMAKQTRPDVLAPNYMLVWETLPANRDRPRTPPLPEPSRLRVVRIEEGDEAP